MEISKNISNGAPTPKSTASSRRLSWFFSGVSVCVLAVALVLVNTISEQRVRTRKQKLDQLEVVDAWVGRFTRKVELTGEIRTLNPVIVYNDCRYYEREIIELIPEGSWVEKGDVVCVLDSGVLQDLRNKQNIELFKAQSRLAVAESREKIQQSQNQRLLAGSQMRADSARHRLQEYQEATALNMIGVKEDSVRLKELQQLQDYDRYRHSSHLAALGVDNLLTLNREQAKFATSERAVNLARGELNIFKTFDHPRSVLQLNAAAENADRDVLTTSLQNRLYQATAEITTLNMKQWEAGVANHLAYLNRSIEACTMRAPRAGEVVYAHRPEEKRWIEVGAKVYYTQDLIRITDRSNLVVAGRISHHHVYQVVEGMPVEFRIPSRLNQKLKGTVNWIAPIPTAAEWYQPADLHHKTQVTLDESPEILEALTLATIVNGKVTVTDRDEVLQVPVRAVFYHQRQHAVIVKRDDDLSCRLIKPGDQNEFSVEILEGLDVGEQVVIEERQRLRQLAVKLIEADIEFE